MRTSAISQEGFIPVARFFEILSYIIGANTISAKCEIGNGTTFYHRGVGCVVHSKTIIGENCTIFQNVTMGNKWPRGKCEGDAPVIGNNVFIGADAVILGAVHIGNNAIIGANAVVTMDVPEGKMVSGISVIIK